MYDILFCELVASLERKSVVLSLYFEISTTISE